MNQSENGNKATSTTATRNNQTNSQMKPKYIKTAAIKLLAKGEGKRISLAALYMLDEKVGRLVNKACSVHNGGKKTIDETVMTHIL